jgi:hypothetical protein
MESADCGYYYLLAQVNILTITQSPSNQSWTVISQAADAYKSPRTSYWSRIVGYDVGQATRYHSYEIMLSISYFLLTVLLNFLLCVSSLSLIFTTHL